MAKRKQTLLLVTHCTATSLKYKLTSEALRKMHQVRGFRDIGYNEWIDRDGVLHVGRGADEIGAHVKGYNSIAYGIALEGCRDVFDATEEMLHTLHLRYHELQNHQYPDAEICGHRDLSPDADGDGIIEPHEHIKACPRFDAIPWAEKIGLQVADIKGVWDTHGKDGPDVRNIWLQKLLRGAGYNVGPLDGHLGKKSKLAIATFQQDHQLEANGKFNKATVKKLREISGVDVRVLEQKSTERMQRQSNIKPNWWVVAPVLLVAIVLAVMFIGR
ncbi:MAG: peptidoglycan-binding domain-containing protein [Rhizobiaceae bacterium]